MDPQKDLTLVEVVLKLHRDYPVGFASFYGAIAFCVLLALFLLWLLIGRGPRRRRGMRHARKLLAAGDWQAALVQLKHTRAIGSPSTSWQKTFDTFEADCIKGAVKAALKEKKFEEALDHGLRAAHINDDSETDVRIGIQNAMLQELRRLFSKHGEDDAIMDLIVRILRVQSPCREATFWQAMCEIRIGALDAALMHLQTAHTGITKPLSIYDGIIDSPSSPSGSGAGGEGEAPGSPPSPYIDPPLYIGAILLRTGRAKEALQFLTEANRMDANCPFITLQLGAAIVTAGGDTNMAVRALQRALGPKGLGQWLDNPDRAWVEGFPDKRSYVRKLAAEFSFVCPLFGDDMKYIIRQGNLALAQGHFKLSNYQEAAVLFEQVLKEGAPSLLVLRGLGLSLAKLGRYDEAFVHLRTAHEMEEVKDRITAGYLALCGAGGKPPRPEDKLQNIAWAIRLVTQFNAPKDPEWLGLLNRIFAEARQHAIPLTSDDQLYLCEHLVSGNAHDAVSAQAYHYLMATDPVLMHPEYAWLYCRADEQHQVGGDKLLAMYIRTFAHQDEARAFFAEHGWNFDDVELMFLRRAAERAPGRFPDVLGPDYLPRGELLLLTKAQQLEDAGEREPALQMIEVLVKLSPNNTSAMDRAAMFHYRAGRLDPATELLQQWHQAKPDDPLPLVRQALLLHQQGHSSGAFARVQDALARVEGRRRANIAFLGARLALQSYLAPNADALPAARGFLHECLASDSGHPQAQWCLAALRWLEGDRQALAAQADDMKNADINDPRYHYLSALCHLLAGQLDAVAGTCERVAQQVNRIGTPAQRVLAIEAGYLAALAHITLDRPRAAVDALKPLTYATNSPTLSHAQALLGEVLFREKRHDEAIAVWQALDAQKRQAWALVEPLAQTTFISALESLAKAEYEQAAEKLRQSGRLGHRDRRLGALLLLALFKAGQQAIYADETAPVVASETAPSPATLVNAGEPVSSTP